MFTEITFIRWCTHFSSYLCDAQDQVDVQPVDPKTVQSAVQVLETSHRVKVVNSVTEKSLARMQAEHSKMNAVKLVFVVAVAHFIVCDNEADSDDLPPGDSDDLPPGWQRLPKRPMLARLGVMANATSYWL